MHNINNTRLEESYPLTTIESLELLSRRTVHFMIWFKIHKEKEKSKSSYIYFSSAIDVDFTLAKGWCQIYGCSIHI